jgi:hypothetical protein
MPYLLGRTWTWSTNSTGFASPWAKERAHRSSYSIRNRPPPGMGRSMGPTPPQESKSIPTGRGRGGQSPQSHVVQAQARPGAPTGKITSSSGMKL